MTAEMFSPHVIRIIPPSEAAEEGHFPREYAELAMDALSWGGVSGAIADAELRRKLHAKPIIQTSDIYKGPDENIIIGIERDNGPKATARDFLTFGWKKLRNTLPF